MSAGITPRMAECRDAIRTLSADGVPPTYEELRAYMGLSSRSRVHRLVSDLHNRGVVEWQCGKKRSLRLVDDGLSVPGLERLTDEQLRHGAALIAGILAHRGGGLATGQAYRRIADAIELKPRVRAEA